MGYLARLTPAGAQANAVRNYRQAQRNEFGAAVTAVETGISRWASPAARNPYSQLIATRQYDVPGLGDPDDSTLAMGAAGSSSTGSTGWMDILKTFVNQVGIGVATKIGGRPPVVAPKPAGFPWGTALAVGGGALALVMLLKKR